MTFDRVLMVDWSGGGDRGPQPTKDAIWIGAARAGLSEPPLYQRNRVVAEETLAAEIEAALAGEARLLIGFDFPFGYPAGFAQAVTGSADPLALWADLAARLPASAEGRARGQVAAALNAYFEGEGPFWFNPFKEEIAGLGRRKPAAFPVAEWREVERRTAGTFSCWQIGGAGSVGSQALTGIATLERLRQRFPGKIAVWPFEPLERAPVAFVEIWPSLIAAEVAAGQQPGEIKDAAQVRILSEAVSRLAPEALARMLDVTAPEEGWILGLGHEAVLAEAARPRRLPGNCFALPPGVAWAPVDQALALLEARLSPVVEALRAAPVAGAVLAAPAVASRANPPRDNAAVDGYAIRGALTARETTFPLAEGRAAAGAPYEGTLPQGHALRILTGAYIPDGADTVILQEDADLGPGHVTLIGPQKQGANRRKAGEDFHVGDTLLGAGRRLTAADLGLLAAGGVREVELFRPLRVGILSTGDEISDAPGPGQIADANRPLLRGLIAQFGHEVVDLGICPDDRAALRARLDEGAAACDAILTSGGASAGEEDHVSALLNEAGSMALWRIAVKPGRPLALGLWAGRPVFGLPGNPVAAMVCTLIFARPALSLLAGAGFAAPLAFEVPASFSKNKKPGRREYLRARLRDGRAEVFASEGSGRISGLSWAEGLVELPDGAAEITPGAPVRFLPFSGFA